MRDKMMQWRTEILKNLGGLPAPEIRNDEWLYLLKDETRNSIMVEGIFVSEQELEQILSHGNYETRNAEDVLNYFSTAKFLYGLGYENHIHQEFTLTLGLIRQINKGIMEGRKRDPGKIRSGAVRIGGAKTQPPAYDIEKWLELYTRFINENINKMQFLRFQALQHDMFEIIHPFEDGNGRAGRIITNYLFVSLGFPIITVKGDEKSKNQYYKALQETDHGFGALFKNTPNYERLIKTISGVNTEQLEIIFFKGLRESMDRMIIKLMEHKGENMLPADKLASTLGYSKASIRKLVERGKLVAVKRGKNYFSHPTLLYK